ncbi:hypothetical protein AALO_G00062030 [Alosa alosa]|uniref:HECT domain-containing protein n=1 Tax=Alosa alosa TaxID=278164 RepID=A0AAV6H3D9_9TELE|nr:G2/M phase-specific E3 ubiquitin-protein ligase-like [Alosa alosa]KAG5280607.1 hypothetical protein AALO_G00062030 [Alosa alosa]
MARLDVIFVDGEDNAEGAVDGGGPTREYLLILIKSIHQSCIFEGPETEKRLTLDTLALKKKTYQQIARMISVCVIHGGVAPGFFSDRLYGQLCRTRTPPATLEEVSDVSFKEKLLKIKDARTVQEAKAAVEEAEDCLAIVGACRSISTLRQRDALVQAAVDYFVEGRLHVALQQFEVGLNTLGLLEAMREHTDLFYNMFVENPSLLKAADLSTLFKIQYSPPGTWAGELETQNICYWRDLLIDIEGKPLKIGDPLGDQ